MRKLICIVLILMLPVIALAEYSSMSYDDLPTMRQKITEEIMSRPEWKEVTVPAGNWEVVNDIPVGFYSITATEDLTIVRLEDKNGHFVFYKTMGRGELCGKAEFARGSVLHINKPVILAPPKGLGF